MAETLNRGDLAPDFSLIDQDGNEVSLQDFRGKWVVLYFYPRDNTQGCTIEAVDFSSSREDFETMNAVILGVSPDSVKSHRGFVEKKDLTITLLADPERKVIKQYGAWQKKKMYGRESYGVARSTVLIGPGGKIAFHWPMVKAKGHAEAVKAKLAELQD